MRFVIALLAIAGIVVSSLALRIHYQDPTAAPPCAVSEHWDCGSINHSRYAVFPATSFDEDPGAHKIHIPVALLGILGYSLIALFALVNRLGFALPIIAASFAFASYLTYLEARVMEKWCIYCVWSMSIITVTFVLTLFSLLLHRRRRFSNSAVVAS